MLRTTLLAVLLSAAPALAEDWQRLDDAGITTALSARVLLYEEGSTQNFFTDGQTLYEAGGVESWGTWWVEGGLYCSTRPPCDIPACYGVEVQGVDLRFTSKGGEVTVGRYQDL